mmetsp:Transcript_43158/g.137837  ORF Transcript_43158/g.137837 Transcript_43158/m.137837 type:complete len:115 (+) Transcript_43158:137-481(+)
MAEEAVEAVMDMEGYLRMAKYPIIRHTDMVEEVRAEAVELCITAVEKFCGGEGGLYNRNFEKASQLVKEGMDKKFGGPWQVIFGEGFGFEVQYEVKNLLYMFHAGQIAILLFKL